jgi:hypothetical protein
VEETSNIWGDGQGPWLPGAITGQLEQEQPLFWIQERPVPAALHLGQATVQKSCNARRKMVENKLNI